MGGKSINLNRRAYLVAGAGGGGVGTAICAMLAEATGQADAIRGAVNVVCDMLPGHRTALTDPLAPEAFDHVVRFDLRATLVASTAHGLGGGIVNVASAAGLVSMAYGAGKAALINLTRTMAVEWGRYRLRVNAVAPGTIRTRRLAAPGSTRPKARRCARRPAT